MRTNKIVEAIYQGQFDERLKEIYVDPYLLSYEKKRYIQAIQRYNAAFGTDEVEIFSAPGRSEIGGNHTDHQNGEVLAASINRDAIAIVRKINRPAVTILSDGYASEITIDLKNLDKQKSEEGTTAALIRGILAKIRSNGYSIGGFQAYVTSDVLIGAGLSSSAAFETLIGTILSYLYNNMEISAVEIAKIGQYAENVYFGKPCGLMDQMACSVGSLVHINFADVKRLKVEQVQLDLDAQGFSLCITDTKGSHADLTPDYAAIPQEMKQVAECSDKEVLGEVSKQEIMQDIPLIREKAGDRALLRAIHFICENERVRQETDALKQNKFSEFLELVKESGDSSYKYLQNVYTNRYVRHQNLSVALAVSDMVLKRRGVSRVHGGGFAGTIQAFVPIDLVENYQEAMEHVFGFGSCQVLKIRKYGGIKVL